MKTDSEKLFRTEVDIEYDGAGVPRVVWHRAGFPLLERVLSPHKPHGRRRMSRDAVRATEAGAR